jgi:D-alanyl-D-alanine carboxypeptidase
VESTLLRRRHALIALAVAAVLSLAWVTPVASRAAAAPRFRGHASPLDSQLRERMTGVSWHRGCPVSLADLRLLAVTHWGFDGEVHIGRLVVNRDAARAMLGAMRSLYRLHYPIRQMRLVDAYGAVDDRSMAADNTSAFNCRFVAGTDRWSEHAYGRAIDLNPLENPYVTESGYVSPPAGAPYADRSRHVRGLIHDGGAVVKAFAAVGWGWGGNWSWPKDYQHFSASGR